MFTKTAKHRLFNPQSSFTQWQDTSTQPDIMSLAFIVRTLNAISQPMLFRFLDLKYDPQRLDPDLVTQSKPGLGKEHSPHSHAEGLNTRADLPISLLGGI